MGENRREDNQPKRNNWSVDFKIDLVDMLIKVMQRHAKRSTFPSTEIPEDYDPDDEQDAHTRMLLG